jgi:hypothetical protein
MRRPEGRLALQFWHFDGFGGDQLQFRRHHQRVRQENPHPLQGLIVLDMTSGMDLGNRLTIQA